MKKLILITILIVVAFIGYSQTTPALLIKPEVNFQGRNIDSLYYEFQTIKLYYENNIAEIDLKLYLSMDVVDSLPPIEEYTIQWPFDLTPSDSLSLSYFIARNYFLDKWEIADTNQIEVIY